MDASKTVPDHFFYQMLEARLQQPDCLANGWLLDGFPHTAPQTETLAQMGIVPDKVSCYAPIQISPCLFVS